MHRLATGPHVTTPSRHCATVLLVPIASSFYGQRLREAFLMQGQDLMSLHPHVTVQPCCPCLLLAPFLSRG
eukprot:1159724-Pelagomonas_calceolata.AAC.5